MPQFTIISDEARATPVTVDGGRVLIDPDTLQAAIGWELKPQGLCRAEECVPVRDRDALFAGDRLDVAAVAAALGREMVVDVDSRVAAMALDATQRQGAVDGLRAPHFTLDDLDGKPHSLSEWRGRKKLLTAFASW